jgi:hypothetical protein
VSPSSVNFKSKWLVAAQWPQYTIQGPFTNTARTPTLQTLFGEQGSMLHRGALDLTYTTSTTSTSSMPKHPATKYKHGSTSQHTTQHYISVCFMSGETNMHIFLNPCSNLPCINKGTTSTGVPSNLLLLLTKIHWWRYSHSGTSAHSHCVGGAKEHGNDGTTSGLVFFAVVVFFFFSGSSELATSWPLFSGAGDGRFTSTHFHKGTSKALYCMIGNTTGNYIQVLTSTKY